jgi:phosphoenolpyruvate carboxykinase (ATP)
MPTAVDLRPYGINVSDVLRNVAPAKLCEDAVMHDGGVISDTGALISRSGDKTGRSPKDKRVVKHPRSSADIWWGAINTPMEEPTFRAVRQRAVDFLNTRSRLYVIDAFAGWDPAHRIKIRVVAARPYHALFMHNMLIRPTRQELADFGKPDFVIFNAGQFPANVHTQTMTSATSVALSFEEREFVILGTEYAGEMKKGVFTIMNYLMPKRGVLSMHCSANEGEAGDISLFFGLSGTGKTTLSTDPRRRLIGDDEHCWTDDGVFNIEGGCYAKCINLSEESEPQIYRAIRFGAVLENVVYDRQTRKVAYDNAQITENTRAAYPIEFIPGAKLPAVAGHPNNIIFLTCDAFGVLPPVARLTPDQAMYHFISGYTAKVAGTEVGVTEPQATFSPCFGAAFLAWHPTKYAELLAERMQQHGSAAWLVNTGWTGGGYGVGKRIKLSRTRAIIDAIHNGSLVGRSAAPTDAGPRKSGTSSNGENGRTSAPSYVEDPVFGLQVPTSCPGVPAEMLLPRNTWPNPAAYDRAAAKLAKLFQDNFAKYSQPANAALRAAGPVGASVS